MTESIGDGLSNTMGSFEFPSDDDSLGGYLEGGIKEPIEDVAALGEGLYNTTGDMVNALEKDTVSHAEALGSDIAGGHPIKAAEDLVGGLWDDGADLVEGVGADAIEAVVAAGAAGISVFTAGAAVVFDGMDVASDVADDIGDGVEDVADDIGDGVEDLADDIGDLF